MFPNIGIPLWMVRSAMFQATSGSLLLLSTSLVLVRSRRQQIVARSMRFYVYTASNDMRKLDRWVITMHIYRRITFYDQKLVPGRCLTRNLFMIWQLCRNAKRAPAIAKASANTVSECHWVTLSVSDWQSDWVWDWVSGNTATASASSTRGHRCLGPWPCHSTGTRHGLALGEALMPVGVTVSVNCLCNIISIFT